MLVYSDDEYGTNGLENLNSAVRGQNVTIYTNQIKTGAINFSSTVRFYYLFDMDSCLHARRSTSWKKPWKPIELGFLFSISSLLKAPTSCLNLRKFNLF